LYSLACEGTLEENVHDVRVSIRRIMPNFYFFEKIFNDDLQKEKYLQIKKYLRSEFSKFAHLRDYQVSREILDNFERDSFHNFDVRYILTKEEDTLKANLVKSLNLNDMENVLNSLKDMIGESEEVDLRETMIEKVKLEKSKFFNLAFTLNSESDTETFHKARIKLKKYRYFKELLYEIYEEEGMDNFERIKTIQDAFGKLQDYNILKNILVDNESNQSYISFLEFEMEIQKNIILDIMKLFLI
jgi:CHAD domain-containing protein